MEVLNNDPNKKEYRELVGAPNQHQVAVGALIEGSCLSKLPANDYYTINTGDTYGQNLDHFMGDMARFKSAQAGSPPPNPIPHITKGYKFNDCIIVANSTCFYIGNGLIITAGHSVFEDAGSNVKAKVAGMKVVFGLTNANCNNKTIPATKVFSIERVCFGQNEPFSPGNTDRADWAILKLDVDPTSPLLPAPLTLRKWASGERIPGAWTVGHPWGIGLTLSSPPDGTGYVSTGGENSLVHNLYVAPANSGGPFFSKANEVIGIVASGPGDIFVGRGFWWVGGSEIIPFIGPDQTFRATKINICRSLTHTDTACFVGLQLPPIQAPAAQKQLLVEILFGNGLEATWQSVTIVNQAAVPNDNIQEYIDYPTLTGRNANFRPWLIRAIRFTYTYPGVGGGPIGGRGGGFLQPPMLPALIFGCMDSGDQGKPADWTILLSEQGCPYVPAAPNLLECPIFLQPTWKAVVNNHIGPLDLVPWQAPSRPRK